MVRIRRGQTRSLPITEVLVATDTRQGLPDTREPWSKPRLIREAEAVPFSFTGQVPDWIDPEMSGWPFRSALVVFTQGELSRETAAMNRHRDPDDGILLPRGPIVLPPVREVWWGANLHEPYLLWELIRGHVRAFGDPGRAGAPPEWIPPRLWKELKPNPANGDLFEGGGSTFWNVRAVSAAEVIVAASFGPTDKSVPPKADTICPTATQASIDSWYKHRAATWPVDSAPPSAKQDWKDAKADFRARNLRPLSVRVAEARRKHAPEEWTKKGRRPKKAASE